MPITDISFWYNRGIPQSRCLYRTRNEHNIPHITVEHQFFKNSYLPSPIIEWNKLDSQIRNSETLTIIKSKILKFIRTIANSICCSHNPIRVKLLTKITARAESLSRIQIQRYK